MTRSLYDALRGEKSEEDVKGVYIATLGLKAYGKGLVGIRTKEAGFEAKHTATVST